MGDLAHSIVCVTVTIISARAGLGTTGFPAGSWEASSIATRFPGSPLDLKCRSGA